MKFSDFFYSRLDESADEYQPTQEPRKITSYDEWIRACRKNNPDAQISGSRSRAQMVDWTTVNNKHVGEWFGTYGIVL